MTSASKVWAHDLEAEPSLQAGCDRRPLRGPVGVAARFGGHTSNGRIAAQGPPTCGPGSGKGGDPALPPPERRVPGRLGLEQALRTSPPSCRPACFGQGGLSRYEDPPKGVTRPRRRRRALEGHGGPLPSLSLVPSRWRPRWPPFSWGGIKQIEPTRAYAQQLVTTRLLDCLHDPVGRPSRLQGIHPGAL